MPFISGGNSSGGGGGSGTVTSIALSDGTTSTTAITTSGTFTLEGSGGVTTSASGLTITIAGGGAESLTTKTANYTVTSSDKFILVDLSGAAADITITMPASTSPGENWKIIDTGSAGTFKTVLDGNGATINGNTTYDMIGPGAAVNIVSTGSQFHIF